MDKTRRSIKLNYATEALKKVSGASMSMRLRLFAFLLVVVVVMLLGVAILFMATGQLSVDYAAAERFVEKEFSRTHRDLTLQIGDATVALVSLSQTLSRSIENQLQSKEIPVSELNHYPETLEDLISNELFRLQLAMEKTGSSGVFMILDATINPNLEYSRFSKAGLYLRDYEPRAIGAPEITWCFLRGFPSIAHQNGLFLQAAWEMEFNVEDVNIYNVTMEMGREASLPLSRLYYWSNESIIPEVDEFVLICSIPLLDSGGNPFGVCGLEISNWNFRFRYAITDDDYPDALSIFGPIVEESMLMRKNVLLSGKQKLPANKTPITLISENGLSRYRSDNGEEYFGIHKEVRMYPADSPHAGEQFALSLLIPKETIDAAVHRTNRMLLSIFLSVLVLGIGVSILISYRYLKPIKSAIDAIKKDSQDALGRTSIREINELLNRIKEMRPKDRPIPDDLFEDFIIRVKTLTPTEMTVFMHYYNGVRINEIPAIMYISINTLKSHNKHIYTKLGISSRDELMLYIELIKKSGLEDRII